jgi:hypothetical protein
MFIGHFAVALGAKKTAPDIKLGTLFFAAQFLDLLWPLFLLLGIEHARIFPGNTAFTPFDFYDYPYSHSLLTTLGWSIGIGGLYFMVRHNRLGSLVLGFTVLSHWILDFFSHRPDLPIAPGLGIFVGLGLWNSISGTIFIEGLLFAAGVFLYLQATESLDRMGTYLLWGLIAFLAIIYAANILSPPPPDMNAVAIAGMAQWIIVLWAYWIDRHRRNRIKK